MLDWLMSGVRGDAASGVMDGWVDGLMIISNVTRDE